MVKNEVNKEVQKMESDCSKKYSDARKGKTTPNLPNQGVARNDILAKVNGFTAAGKKHYAEGGFTCGALFTKDLGHWDFVADVMKDCITSNPLHIDEYLYVTQMEAEIIRWTLDLYKGDENTCGIVTSGGTESIILAILAYREQGLIERSITKPNIVCSETVHPAFDKGGHYLGVEIRKVPLLKNFMADVKAMKRQIDSNTICLVASAPEYPFGNMDPVEEVAALAQSYGIGCHSDCCIGSYINPFMEELGHELPSKFDFRVPGVTSISCDPHKYALGPKGCSLLMFREKRLREYQFFANTEWNGGIYATTCMAGSRPGNVIAGTWASLLSLGREGLKKQAAAILGASRNMRAAFKDDPDITVISQHDSCIFAFTSKNNSFHGMAICDVLKKERKWAVGTVQRPAGAHLTITAANADNWQDFVDSIRACVKILKSTPELNKNDDTALYCMTAQIPDKSMLHQFVSIHEAAMLDTLK